MVVSAVIEINFITDIESQTDGTDMAFYAAAGIKGAHHVVVAEILHVTKERADGGRRAAEMSVQEAAFESDKWVEIRMSKRHLGAEQPMQQSHIGAVNDY